MRVVMWTGKSSPHVGRIEFDDPRRQDHGFVVTATVELDGIEQSVDVEMIEPYRGDMAGFFADMAANANGWSGVMTWESEYSVMRLDARNPGTGQVALDVMMRWPPTYDDEWYGSLEVEASSLPGVAAAMKRLLGVDNVSRFRTPNAPPSWQPLPR
jgi:hypothetical protein